MPLSVRMWSGGRWKIEFHGPSGNSRAPKMSENNYSL